MKSTKTSESKMDNFYSEIKVKIYVNHALLLKENYSSDASVANVRDYIGFIDDVIESKCKQPKQGPRETAVELLSSKSTITQVSSEKTISLISSKESRSGNSSISTSRSSNARISQEFPEFSVLSSKTTVTEESAKSTKQELSKTTEAPEISETTIAQVNKLSKKVSERDISETENTQELLKTGTKREVTKTTPSRESSKTIILQISKVRESSEPIISEEKITTVAQKLSKFLKHQENEKILEIQSFSKQSVQHTKDGMTTDLQPSQERTCLLDQSDLSKLGIHEIQLHSDLIPVSACQQHSDVGHESDSVPININVEYHQDCKRDEDQSGLRQVSSRQEDQSYFSQTGACEQDQSDLNRVSTCQEEFICFNCMANRRLSTQEMNETRTARSIIFCGKNNEPKERESLNQSKESRAADEVVVNKDLQSGASCEYGCEMSDCDEASSGIFSGDEMELDDEILERTKRLNSTDHLSRQSKHRKCDNLVSELCGKENTNKKHRFLENDITNLNIKYTDGIETNKSDAFLVSSNSLDQHQELENKNQETHFVEFTFIENDKIETQKLCNDVIQHGIGRIESDERLQSHTPKVDNDKYLHSNSLATCPVYMDGNKPCGEQGIESLQRNIDNKQSRDCSIKFLPLHIVQSAKIENTLSMLDISNESFISVNKSEEESKNNVSEMLDNPQQIQYMLQNPIQLVNIESMHGFDINLEKDKQSHDEKISELLKKIRTEIHKNNEKYESELEPGEIVDDVEIPSKSLYQIQGGTPKKTHNKSFYLGYRSMKAPLSRGGRYIRNSKMPYSNTVSRTLSRCSDFKNEKEQNQINGKSSVRDRVDLRDKIHTNDRNRRYDGRLERASSPYRRGRFIPHPTKPYSINYRHCHSHGFIQTSHPSHEYSYPCQNERTPLQRYKEDEQYFDDLYKQRQNFKEKVDESQSGTYKYTNFRITRRFSSPSSSQNSMDLKMKECKTHSRNRRSNSDHVGNRNKHRTTSSDNKRSKSRENGRKMSRRHESSLSRRTKRNDPKVCDKLITRKSSERKRHKSCESAIPAKRRETKTSAGDTNGLSKEDRVECAVEDNTTSPNKHDKKILSVISVCSTNSADHVDLASSKNDANTETCTKKDSHMKCFNLVRDMAFKKAVHYSDENWNKYAKRKFLFEDELIQQLERNYDRYLYSVNNSTQSCSGNYPLPRFVSDELMTEALVNTWKKPQIVASLDRQFREFDEIIGYVGYNIPCYWCEMIFAEGKFVRAFPVLDPIGHRDDTMYCQTDDNK